MPIVTGTASHNCETRPAGTGRVLDCQLGGDIEIDTMIQPQFPTATVGAVECSDLIGPILLRHWFRPDEKWGCAA